MKKIISIFLLLATVATVSAQRFEWAKGFESCYDYGALIQSAVTDSLGNLYIIGSFEYDAEWMSGNGGIPLLPEVQFNHQIPHLSVLIAKISPEGEMLWKKVVCNDNGGVARPYDIRLVGDTAIACMFDFTVPCYASSCYYLDTLLVGFSEDNYPCNALSFAMTTALALVTFDFDGNVIEDHFLRFTAVDNSGNDVLTYCWLANVYTGLLGNMFIQDPTFNIDRAGNIYLYRQTNDIITDSLSADKGAFSAIKIWDDTVLVGSFPVEGNPQRWWQQVLKFSPHFDTLLASRYTIQKADSVVYGDLYLYSVLDDEENIYTIATLESIRGGSSRVIFDSVQNLEIICSEHNLAKGYLLKLDSDLNIKWVVDFQDSIISTNNQLTSNNGFLDVVFDNEKNLIFASASSGRGVVGDTSNYYSILTYRGTPLSLKSGGFIIALSDSNNVPVLQSYTQNPSLGEMLTAPPYNTHGNLACSNNRLFVQSKYRGGLRYGGIDRPSVTLYNLNMGFFVFDYAGNVINHYSYDIDTMGTDWPGPIVLRDSILYLMPDIQTHATFGNTTIYSCKHYACIAKYVDTSFMSLYVRPEPDAGIRPPAAMTSVTLYPNPATTSLSIVSDTPVAPQAYIINSTGIRMPATIQNNTLDVSRLSPGNYFLETYINNNKLITKFVKL